MFFKLKKGSLIETKDLIQNTNTPYGERDNRTGEDFNIIDFTLKSYDRDLQAIRMGRRYYDPKAKVFLTPDSYFVENYDKIKESPVEGNLYNYAGNNPVSYNDPNGDELVKAFSARSISAETPTLKERTFLLDKKVARQGASFVKESLKVFKILSVNNTFRIKSSDKIKTTNTKAKGPSRHQAGFAIDFNGVPGLSKSELGKLNSIASKHGFKPLRNQGKDKPHFSVDPKTQGYKSLKSAIRENKSDFKAKGFKLNEE